MLYMYTIYTMYVTIYAHDYARQKTVFSRRNKSAQFLESDVKHLLQKEYLKRVHFINEVHQFSVKKFPP